MNAPIFENGHIDEYFLSLYADEALPPEDMTAVATHVAGCATCQSEVADLRQRMALAGREPAGYGPGAHMPELWLSRYADGESPAEEAALVKAHLATCERCRHEVEETRWFTGELKRAVARRRRPPADPTRGLVTVAMLQARPQFPKGEGDPEILRLMREVLEQDGPEAPEPAPAVAVADDDHRILRPKRPWWTAPVVALAVAAALAVVALAPLCRGFPGLRACLGERLGSAGLVQVARFLVTPTPAPSTTPVGPLVVRGGPPPTPSPTLPTRTPTPERTRFSGNNLATLRAAANATATVLWLTPAATWTPLPPDQATYVAEGRQTDAASGGAGSELGPEEAGPAPTRPTGVPAWMWATQQAATATDTARRIRYPHRIYVPFASNYAVTRRQAMLGGEIAPSPTLPRRAGAGAGESAVSAGDSARGGSDNRGERAQAGVRAAGVLAAGVNLVPVGVVACMLAVASLAFALGWQLRGLHGSTLSRGESGDMRRHHVSAVIWLNVQNLTGYQRPDPGAPLNGRNPHER